MLLNILGFNGQWNDPVTGSTHPGNGYRAYNFLQMRFACPDNFSPFGSGGLNPYVYCLGDPVNREDPSGHFSIGGAIGIGLGVLGIIFTPLTGGTSLAAVISLSAAMAGVASAGLSIASEFVHDAKTSSIMSWVALGLGIVSMLGAGIASKLAPEVRSLSYFLRGAAHNRPFGGLMIEAGEVAGPTTQQEEVVQSLLSGITPRLTADGSHPLETLPQLGPGKSGRGKAMKLFWKSYKYKNRSVIGQFKIMQGTDALSKETDFSHEASKVFFKKGSRAWLKDNVSAAISERELRKLHFLHAEVLKAAPLDENELRYLEHVYKQSGIEYPSRFTRPESEDKDFGPFGDLISFE